MTPKIAVQQYAVHEQCNWSTSLFEIADASGRNLNAAPDRRGIIRRHGLAPPRGGSRSGRFLQCLCALLAANLNRFATDGDLDGISIERAIARCTCSLSHGFLLQ